MKTFRLYYITGRKTLHCMCCSARTLQDAHDIFLASYPRHRTTRRALLTWEVI